MNQQIFKKYSFNHTSLFLAKELYNTNQNVNDKIVKHINDALIELKKDINRKKNPNKENPNKIVDTFEKILNFNKQQKGNRLPLDLARMARVAKVSDHFNLQY